MDGTADGTFDGGDDGRATVMKMRGLIGLTMVTLTDVEKDAPKDSKKELMLAMLMELKMVEKLDLTMVTMMELKMDGRTVLEIWMAVRTEALLVCSTVLTTVAPMD